MRIVLGSLVTGECCPEGVISVRVVLGSLVTGEFFREGLCLYHLYRAAHYSRRLRRWSSLTCTDTKTT